MAKGEIDAEILSQILLLNEDTPGFAASLLDTWNQEISRDMTRLEEAVAGGQLELAAKLAHGCRGIAATVGALDCSEAFLKLEQVLDFGRLDELRPTLDVCADRTEAATQRLRELLLS